MCRRLSRYLVVRHRTSTDPDAVLGQLAYTLDKQTKQPFRLAIVACTLDDLVRRLTAAALSPVSRREKAGTSRIAFVFSGQGAQYAEMGRELLRCHPAFMHSLERARQLLVRLGCNWDLLSELCRPKAESRINNPAVSQPASTAVQLALVDLLEKFGVVPDAVVGHSSGEIAAAYAAGGISFEDAMTASFFRGQLTGELISGKLGSPGAMLAVGAGPDDIKAHISNISTENGQLGIACHNSPSSVTVSGDEAAIDQLKAVLDTEGTFNRKLMTNGAAYHSHQMRLIEDDYAGSLKRLNYYGLSSSVRMFSSVTGKEVNEGISLDGRYWAQNLTSPVLFSQGLQELCGQEYRGQPIDTVVEVGPHSQLGGPVKQILKAMKKGGQVAYTSTLKRGKEADVSLLECLGLLHVQAASIPLRELNSNGDGSPDLLVDLPPYPFDHSRTFWHETRISKDYRHRRHTPHELLGSLSPDHNPLEPRWRQFIGLKESPWLRGHVVQGQVLFPAAGFLTMAIQAACQHLQMRAPNERVESVLFRNISIDKGLVLSEDGPDVEIQLSLRPEARTARESSSVWSEFRIFTVTDGGKWTEHCRGALQVETKTIPPQEAVPNLKDLAQIEASCTHESTPQKFYHLSRRAGLDYQSHFENVTSFRASRDAAVITAVEPAYEMAAGGMGDFMHPAVLDSALFHGLCSIVFVERGHKSAFVPTFIEGMRVFRGAPRAGRELVTTTESKEPTVFDVVVRGKADEGLSLVAHGVRVTALPGDVQDQVEDELCHSIDWVTYVDAWTPGHRDQACKSAIEKSSSLQLNQYLDALTLHYVTKAVKQVVTSGITLEYRQHLFSWIQLVTRDLPDVPPLPVRPVGLKPDAFENGIHRLGARLSDILTGEADPLSLLTPDDLLTRLYQTERTFRCVDQMSEYTRHLGLQTAGLKVLEIGAGTAFTTLPILTALQGTAAEYTFTDLSPGFFKSAKRKLGDLAEGVEFKTLDAERDPAEQGFEEGSYDLVIASNVIHTCSSITGVLSNIRPLLKPGGRFMLMELTTDTPHYNLLFGVFEGWWAGYGEGRKLSPLLTPEAWTRRLQGVGFVDADPIFSDFEKSEGGTLSVFVARTPWESPREEMPPVHLVTRDSTSGSAILESRAPSIQSRVPGSRISVQPLSAVSFAGNVAVIMPEVAKLLASTQDPVAWGSFKNWVLNARAIILVTSGNSESLEDTDTAFWPGFARCLRRERPDIRIITLEIEASGWTVPDKLVEVLPTVLQSPSLDLGVDSQAVENEFSEKNGQLFVPRAFHRSEVSEHVHAARHRASPQLLPFLDPSRTLTAELATPGLMETLRWTDDGDSPAVGPDDIRFELRAASVNFKDVLIAAGQLDGITEMRNDCSGVVLEVGENMRNRFKTGDRVCALYSRSYTNYPVVHGDCCAVVPDTMSFEEAAALPIVSCTVYHSLVDKGQLSRGDTVLIHSAAGAVGQAAIILSQHLGAEVFVTVSSEAKRTFLHETYGVPYSHMFSSRTTEFYNGIKRLTSNRGVDVVLNSLSGEMFRTSCNLVAPFGRFVEIGRKDLMDDALMPMSFLLRNITFSYVELSLVIDGWKALAGRILGDVVKLAALGAIRPVSIQTYPMDKIEDAFRLIQAGKHMGKIILRVEEDQKVKVRPPQPIRQQNESSTDAYTRQPPRPHRAQTSAQTQPTPSLAASAA